MPAVTKPAGNLPITTYRGFKPFGDGRGSPKSPLEIDLTVALAECPDKNVEINSLHIGGWRYNVAGLCQNALNDGVLRVEGFDRGSASVVAGTHRSHDLEQPQVMSCDPTTWRCGSVR
jgi:hypothetical protein